MLASLTPRASVKCRTNSGVTSIFLPPSDTKPKSSRIFAIMLIWVSSKPCARVTRSRGLNEDASLTPRRSNASRFSFAAIAISPDSSAIRASAMSWLTFLPVRELIFCAPAIALPLLPNAPAPNATFNGSKTIAPIASIIPEPTLNNASFSGRMFWSIKNLRLPPPTVHA